MHHPCCVARVVVQAYVCTCFMYVGNHTSRARATHNLRTGSPQRIQQSQIANLLIARHTPAVNLWRGLFGHRLTWSPQLPSLTTS